MARMRALVGMWRRWRILLSRCDGARRRLPCPFSPLAEASIPGGVAVGGFCVAPCRRRGDFWPRNRVLARAGSVFPPISTLVEALAKETPGRRRIVANAPTVFVPERGFVAKNERFRGIGALRGARDVGMGGPRHVARRALARFGTRAASGTGVWRDVGARRRSATAGQGIAGVGTGVCRIACGASVRAFCGRSPPARARKGAASGTAWRRRARHGSVRRSIGAWSVTMLSAPLTNRKK